MAAAASRPFPPAALEANRRGEPTAAQSLGFRICRGKACGCAQLRRRVFAIRPRVHCFGHVHASSGTLDCDGMTFVNASMVDSRYRITRQPYVVDL
jgi:Icc-related predicted phosphoesterase